MLMADCRALNQEWLWSGMRKAADKQKHDASTTHHASLDIDTSTATAYYLWEMCRGAQVVSLL